MTEILGILKQAPGVIKILTLFAKLFPNSKKCNPEIVKAVNLVERYAVYCAKCIYSNNIALIDGHSYLHEPASFYDEFPPVESTIADMPPNSPPELINYLEGVKTLIENIKADDIYKLHPDIRIQCNTHDEINSINNKLGWVGYTAILQAELVRNRYRLPNPTKLMLKGMSKDLKLYSKRYHREMSPVYNWILLKWKYFRRCLRSTRKLILKTLPKR